MKFPNVTISAVLAATLLSVTAAFAQAPAATVAPKATAASVAPAAPAAAPAAASKGAPAAKAEKKAAAKPNKQFTAQTAKSKACSVKADEQKLHGKARQKFREECKKAA